MPSDTHPEDLSRDVNMR